MAQFAHAAELLSNSEAKLEQAIALYHLGETLFSSRHARSRAMRALEHAAGLSEQVGSHQFLLERALLSPEVVEYAASKRIGGGFYRTLLEKIESRRQPRQQKAEAARSKTARFPSVELFALGPMQAIVGGRRVLDFEWQSDKSREMFLFLLHRRCEPARKEEILAALWPDLPRDRCNSSFHSTLYRLRRALYTECVVEQTGRYVLNPRGRFWFDVSEFETLVRSAEQSRQQSTRWTRSLRQALALYRGPLGVDFYSDWLEPERQRLEDTYLRSLARLAAHERQRNNYLEALTLYEKAVGLDPLNESLWYQFIDTHGEAGQLEAAMRCYQRYADTVRDQLGEEPAAELADLCDRMRASLTGSR